MSALCPWLGPIVLLAAFFICFRILDVNRWTFYTRCRLWEHGKDRCVLDCLLLNQWIGSSEIQNYTTVMSMTWELLGRAHTEPLLWSHKCRKISVSIFHFIFCYCSLFSTQDLLDMQVVNSLYHVNWCFSDVKNHWIFRPVLFLVWHRHWETCFWSLFCLLECRLFYGGIRKKGTAELMYSY